MSTDPSSAEVPRLQAGSSALAANDFVRNVARSRLLDEPRIERLFAEAPPQRKWQTAAFAEHLVALGELTAFQADKLLRGHWQGLSLGPYALLCPIGRGGMGVVYLARKRNESELVALKVLPPKRAKDEPRMLTRFQREIEIGLRMPVHPNLTRSKDAGEWSDVHYLAMEYVTGKTVRERVLESGPLSVGEAARIFTGVALGLHAAHEAGFVHRDIKPGNIIIDPSGQAKVLDFGFALIRGESLSSDPSILGGQGYTLGTMDFLPPEQATNAATVGPAADLYSLGCSLYFAMTGSLPFPGGTAQDKIRAHRNDTPDSVLEFNPILSAEFVRLIDWLMDKRPQKRPKSAAEIARHLQAWAEPMAGKPPASSFAELLALAEARWIEQAAAAGAVEVESIVILDADPTTAPAPLAVAKPVALPVARPVLPQLPLWPLLLPLWVVGLAGVVGGFAILVAMFIGWVLARLIAG